MPETWADLLHSAPVSWFMQLPTHTRLSIAATMLLALLFHSKFDVRTVLYGPTILTTTGIFFTFWAVAVGLADFDAKNVQSSVPALLASLQTAFWASVFGVGGALSLKLRHFAGLKRNDDDGEVGEVTAADLARLLTNIRHSLTGNDEGSIVTQLKLARQDTNDRLDALTKAQTEALNKLSESGSKALVEALRRVIIDFNEKITEQFGDNFKQLNEAVGKLLEWQEQYRRFVDEITLRLAQITASMTESSGHYANLVTKSDAFVTSAEQLSALLSGLEKQRTLLADGLTELAKILATAAGAMPEIEKKIVGLTDQLTSSVSQNQSELNRALVENAAAIKSSLESASREFGKTNQDFNQQISNLTAKTKEQVAVLDAALSEELQKSLQSLGRQLAALSEKFVSDYEPLTEKLARVVSLARN